MLMCLWAPTSNRLTGLNRDLGAEVQQKSRAGNKSRQDSEQFLAVLWTLQKVELLVPML